MLAEVATVYRVRPQTAAPAASLLERIRTWLGNLRPPQALAMAGVGALAAMLLFMGISRIAPRPLAAAAQVAGGDITVLRTNNNTYRIYQDGDIFKLNPGDHIVAQDGAVTLALFPNQHAVLQPGAHMEITEIDDANGGTQVAMLVHAGQVQSIIDETLDSNDRFVVLAPNLSMEAHGTDFAVEVVSDRLTRISTFEGAVQVQMDGQAVTVNAGEVLDAVQGLDLIVQKLAEQANTGGDTIILTDLEAKDLTLYTAPDETSPVIGVVAVGQPFELLDRDDSNTWYQVCCVEQRSGWVHIATLATDAVQ